MSAKTKEYFSASLTVLILLLLIFAFDLPKGIFISLAITIPFVIFLHIVFPHKNKCGRKEEYITDILLFVVFASLVFIFNLPTKLYLFFGILFASNSFLYELFNLIKNKENKT